jgi:hypothetical protein
MLSPLLPKSDVYKQHPQVSRMLVILAFLVVALTTATEAAGCWIDKSQIEDPSAPPKLPPSNRQSAPSPSLANLAKSQCNDRLDPRLLRATTEDKRPSASDSPEERVPRRD